MITSRAFVARSKSDPKKYAYEGRISGWHSIEDGSLHWAKKFESPAALMAWLGGHYKGYEAVEITTKIFVGQVKPWPAEEKVFNR